MHPAAMAVDPDGNGGAGAAKTYCYLASAAVPENDSCAPHIHSGPTQSPRPSSADIAVRCYRTVQLQCKERLGREERVATRAGVGTVVEGMGADKGKGCRP